MYYPKSQITPNLYTIGNELFLDGESYTGYYFKTSDGKFYSGKTPNDSFVVQLYPNVQNFWEATAETNTSFEQYQSFNCCLVRFCVLVVILLSENLCDN